METSLWSKVVQRALDRGILSETTPKVFIYHLDKLQNTWKQLFDAFPPKTLHTFALKACPVKGVLSLAFSYGFGAECASIGEVYLAKSFGCPSERIVFDSPVKTMKDLKLALDDEIYINADNFQELEKIQQLLRENEEELCNKQVRVGLRINPQIGSGLIQETSTASAQSKFGVPLKEKLEEIVECFQRYSFLKGIHVHVGSQGCTWELLEQGIRAGVDLLVQLRERFPERLQTLDIGGGLSADYDGVSQGASFEEYVSRLERVAPELFDSSLQLITEFGRRLCAKAGIFVSRVEYTKQSGNRNIVLCHIGADNFLRPVYLPKNWKHRILVLDKQGGNKLLDGREYPMIEQDIAGPLCFSGDIFATGRLLPRCEPGDWLVVLDSGAYTLSMYSRHTSQWVSAVYGFHENSNEPFQLLKKEESPEELIRFWS
ncbi:diaminopimelate decarboxylase [Galdieria sulphuraria]|uniref:Diaminopimelate decarboxylase n=1 Tax=Galdieria sulphuraria TaxID=130081 RepID=M2Y7M0_GALSU|nr:diaminopimelate decarboxylase [Galdieria sulphuraria]EME32063.1 diaminopimelate decarboxylase [Galdieria sulphuraria]|eukprot:XP_005708583.1 diaminopimelate decarboxylase [Galdieria sulphuraria]